MRMSKLLLIECSTETTHACVARDLLRYSVLGIGGIASFAPMSDFSATERIKVSARTLPATWCEMQLSESDLFKVYSEASSACDQTC